MKMLSDCLSTSKHYTLTVHYGQFITLFFYKKQTPYTHYTQTRPRMYMRASTPWVRDVFLHVCAHVSVMCVMLLIYIEKECNKLSVIKCK